MGTVAIAPEGGRGWGSEVEVGRGAPAGQRPTGVGSGVPKRPTTCSCEDEGDCLEDEATPPCPDLSYKTKAQTETAVLCALLEVRQPRDSFSFLVEEEKHEASRFPLQENTAPRGLCPTDTGAVGSARGWCPEPEPRVIRREARE